MVWLACRRFDFSMEHIKLQDYWLEPYCARNGYRFQCALISHAGLDWRPRQLHHCCHTRSVAFLLKEL